MKIILFWIKFQTKENSQQHSFWMFVWKIKNKDEEKHQRAWIKTNEADSNLISETTSGQYTGWLIQGPDPENLLASLSKHAVLRAELTTHSRLWWGAACCVPDRCRTSWSLSSESGRPSQLPLIQKVPVRSRTCLEFENVAMFTYKSHGTVALS